MPKVTIDGHEIEVPEGQTILQAAMSVGREIPHYCYHPGLSIAGNCRMCLVEVEKAPKLVIGCQTPVTDGMVVNTKNDRVKEAQTSVMEFLLINHPLDCPICDQAGECKLQDYAVSYGSGVSRFTEKKLALNKAVDIGPHVMLDQERCIQCSRCVRFCDEVTQTSELAFFQRGERSMIGISPGRPLANEYSGNVVDICPVGALTLKELRFTNRVWYLKNTPSICAGCSRGCNVVVAVGKQQELMTTTGQLDDRIKRLVPRVNEEVNGHWMCDAGRLSYLRLQAGERLTAAEVPEGTEVEWDDAVKQAAEALHSSAEAGRAAAILSPRLTNETYYALSQLFGALGGVRVGIRSLIEGADDELLVLADKGANSQGAQWILGNAWEQGVRDAIAGGEIDVLLVVGDPLDADDTPGVDESLTSMLKQVLYIGSFRDEAAKGASVVLPACAWAEENGTIVNFEGRVQRVRRAHRSRGEGRPAWRVVAEIIEAAGFESEGWSSEIDVLAALASGVPHFEGMTEESIGLLGAASGAAAGTAK
ncbi:MAG: molybdopterin-dependent oxidoreductase [bacterium]|nr:molybdopterin-dependent oxidoreductase [bacterium]